MGKFKTLKVFFSIVLIFVTLCKRQPEKKYWRFDDPDRPLREAEKASCFTPVIDKLNVYAKPSVQSKVIKVIQKGERMFVRFAVGPTPKIVDGKVGGWLIIILGYENKEFVEGYVFDAFITKMFPIEEDLRKTYIESPDIPAGHGVIEGRFTFPSEYIPGGMEACAEDIVSKKIFCIKEYVSFVQNEQRRTGTFRLPVPPGSYHVFQDNPYTQAMGLYTQRVLCGLAVGCDDGSLIVVNVNAGETKNNISPADSHHKFVDNAYYPRPSK